MPVHPSPLHHPQLARELLDRSRREALTPAAPPRAQRLDHEQRRKTGVKAGNGVSEVNWS